VNVAWLAQPLKSPLGLRQRGFRCRAERGDKFSRPARTCPHFSPFPVLKSWANIAPPLPGSFSAVSFARRLHHRILPLWRAGPPKIRFCACQRRVQREGVTSCTGTMVPEPSFSVWIESRATFSKRSVTPLGQRTCTESILVAAPSPKCTRMSLLES
jgi:hypothetical protein